MKPNSSRPLFLILSLLILVSMAVVPVHASAQIAVTGAASTGSASPDTATPNLALFIEQVNNGSTEQITGLYVENLFSYPVIQQPSNQAAYVSPNDNLVTQFSSASDYGSLGFLAHNNLAGVKFPEIKNGDVISVIYGDGHYIQYQVTQIRSLQALQPNNPYSSFLDLSNNQILTVEEVFYQTYGVRDQLVLQTCISFQGSDSWGRLFVMAVPYTSAPLSVAVPRINAEIRNRVNQNF